LVIIWLEPVVNVATAHVVRTLMVEVDLDDRKYRLWPKSHVQIPPN
jgi:hypothetical protein